ncbi:AraC family transcriptional regulator [Verminephrobacter aporrectodeae subsp. tuberculatae]|uniref:helix-turn-helix transcriptional regulator n=1 Tax=Verminephrobacter aporrectodeae TaxID=1110389 RepID=UPI002238FAE2|nr:AraC family transcriptional regulator [Verminephrobacter aporrectodeae]MCW5258003.1 AraC family transcriptional regulator [Verminephrobacter aporrectodeae subsp. tuberculatae]
MQALNSAEFFETQSRWRTPHPGVQVRTIGLQPGFAVSLVVFDTGQDVCAMTQEEGARVHFNCLLRGETRVCCDGQSFALDRANVLASFAPGKRFQLECSADCCNIELRITPQLLSQLAGEECARLCLFRGNDSCLFRSPGNLRIRDAAERLGRLLIEEHSSSLLVHSSALEFLAWHLKSLQPESAETGVCPREHRQLLAARERLLSDLSQPPTIEQLARETGLNQLKIKRGFKILFGISVYALFQRERMERARHLMQRHNVTETASLLGYSNLSHFSAAFRKQFGILPSTARRLG